MMAFKSAYFVKEGLIFKSCYELEIDPQLTMFLDSAPMFCFVIGSLLNLGYSYQKYLLIEKSVCEFNNKPYDVKTFKKKILCFNIVISVLVIGTVVYYVHLSQVVKQEGYEYQYNFIFSGFTLLAVGICFLIISGLKIRSYRKSLPFFYQSKKVLILFAYFGSFLPLFICSILDFLKVTVPEFEVWGQLNY